MPVPALPMPALIVLLTVLVRVALLPLSVRIVRADLARRALAPRVAELRMRHRGDPQRLTEELLAAHRDAGISPFAGLGAALAQAPVLYGLYRLCSSSVVANATLFGMPLSQHGLAAVASAGFVSAPAAVFVVAVLMLMLVATWSGSTAVARLDPQTDQAGLNRTLARVLPFTTVGAAFVMPFAVVLYLLTSTAWATAERRYLPLMLAK
ncbi:membrane protein insertase YidC [Spongisporangium articulatum]|uniref:Membrane protein insertase YidC n=1 Tax=Spongisporangium articulatum TaxID=3362603 RepID=A0ABW8AMB8_9ACTN